MQPVISHLNSACSRGVRRASVIEGREGGCWAVRLSGADLLLDQAGAVPGRLSSRPLAEADHTGRQPVADPAPPSPDLQQKYRQFLDLLPLTIALAGLPPSEGRLFGEDQIEGRGITIKMAYRVARNVAKECLGGS